jgi:hypothetical protein
MCGGSSPASAVARRVGGAESTRSALSPAVAAHNDDAHVRCQLRGQRTPAEKALPEPVVRALGHVRDDHARESTQLLSAVPLRCSVLKLRLRVVEALDPASQSKVSRRPPATTDTFFEDVWSEIEARALGLV